MVGEGIGIKREGRKGKNGGRSNRNLARGEEREEWWEERNRNIARGKEGDAW
jgi:hypothetical protein